MWLLWSVVDLMWRVFRWLNIHSYAYRIEQYPMIWFNIHHNCVSSILSNYWQSHLHQNVCSKCKKKKTKKEHIYHLNLIYICFGIPQTGNKNMTLLTRCISPNMNTSFCLSHIFQKTGHTWKWKAKHVKTYTMHWRHFFPQNFQ